MGSWAVGRVSNPDPNDAQAVADWANHPLASAIGSAIPAAIASVAFYFILGWAVSRALKQFKKCEHCAETIRAEARVCKHCGRDVVDVASAGASMPDARSAHGPIDRAPVTVSGGSSGQSDRLASFDLSSESGCIDALKATGHEVKHSILGGRLAITSPDGFQASTKSLSELKEIAQARTAVKKSSGTVAKNHGG
jgi:hypothetical protein